MDLLNTLIENSPFAILSVFLLGLLVAFAPCPLAANIAAVGYLAKTAKGSAAWQGGLYYTAGRGLAYTLIATLIYFGASAFSIAGLFQGWGDKVVGPILILLGLVVAGVIKVNLPSGGQKWAALKSWLAARGGWGAFGLGALLALAFCPYSGAVFFGALMPLVLNSPTGLILPLFFAVGTSLPVAVFAFLIAFGSSRLGAALGAAQKIEKPMRYLAGGAMVLAGVYYSRALLSLFG